jgi:hypothetical protein
MTTPPEVRRTPPPPMPVFRATFTVAPPGCDTPATVQIVILADGDDANPTADRSQVPELDEAGWTGSLLGQASVYVRIVG